MLSERARHYLSTMTRIPAVPTEEIERVLKRQGDKCFPAWLEFHERYAGYIEPLGLESAVLGIVHTRSRWIRPGCAIVSRSYESNAFWFVTCADVHPSYVYSLGDSGFFRERPASSFEVNLERSAARVAFFGEPGPTRPQRFPQYPPAQALLDRLQTETSIVAEASDEHYQVLLGERLYAVRETSTGRLVDGGMRE
jgi:hypothetical protein